MSTQDRTAAKCRSLESQRRSFSITPARRLIGCAVLVISFGLTEIQCFNEPDGKPSVWNCSCTLTAQAAADEKKSESDKKAQEKEKEQTKKDQERQREQTKKDQEREREQEKKDQERQKEQAKKDQKPQKEQANQDQERQKEQAKQDQEQQKEQAKKSLEREFEQSKKALEQSGASEKDKQELEDRFERDKKTLESGNQSLEVKPPATLVEFFKRKFKPRAKKPKDKDKEPRQRIKKSKEDEQEPKQITKKPNEDEQGQKQTQSENKKSRRTTSQNRGPRTTFKRGEILAVNPNSRERNAAQKLGFRIISSTKLSRHRGQVVRLIAPPGLDTRRARELLKREVPTGSFELNKKYRVYHAANGRRAPEKPGAAAKAFSPRSRGLSNRKARSAKYACEADHCFSRSVLHWKQDLENCSGGVRIGIIDTNVDVTHRTFQGQNIRSGNFIPPYKQASSDSHGTAVASILAGSRNSSTPGLVPAAEFFTANIFYADENGHPATDTLTLLKALDWLEAWDVQLVNMSFVGPEDPLIHEALRRMSAKRTVFVAAIGNEGPAAPPRYPAAYPEVIAVTAVNSKLNGYRRANRGPFIDVAAPGVNIWTALPDNREGYQSGTSFAAPHVTALLATIYKGRENERTRDQLMKYLPVRDLGSRGRDKIYGRGLVMAPSDCRGTNRPQREIAWTTKRTPKKEVAKSAVFSPAGRLWEPAISRSRTAAEGSLSLN